MQIIFFNFPGLCIPSNNTIFIKSISEKLAANEPHLTLEFLEECIQGFRNSNIEMKHLCLEYMTPWLPNLTRWVGLGLYRERGGGEGRGGGVHPGLPQLQHRDEALVSGVHDSVATQPHQVSGARSLQRERGEEREGVHPGLPQLQHRDEALVSGVHDSVATQPHQVSGARSL